MRAWKFRDVENMVEGAGLMVVSVEQTSHFKARVRRLSDGRETMITFAVSPGDRRAELNQRAYLRRFAKGDK